MRTTENPASQPKRIKLEDSKDSVPRNVAAHAQRNTQPCTQTDNAAAKPSPDQDVKPLGFGMLQEPRPQRLAATQAPEAPEQRRFAAGTLLSDGLKMPMTRSRWRNQNLVPREVSAPASAYMISNGPQLADLGRRQRLIEEAIEHRHMMLADAAIKTPLSPAPARAAPKKRCRNSACYDGEDMH